MTAWLVNLIPLKAPPLREHQLVGWQPKTIAMQGLGCRLLADQRVPVDGDVSLSADVYTPKRPSRYPAIVMFAAYCRELHTAGIPTGSNEIGSPPIFTDRGYAVVVLSRRGMGRSGGRRAFSSIRRMSMTICAASPGRRSSHRCETEFKKIDRSMPIVADIEQIADSSKFPFEIKSAIF